MRIIRALLAGLLCWSAGLMLGSWLIEKDMHWRVAAAATIGLLALLYLVITQAVNQ